MGSLEAVTQGLNGLARRLGERLSGDGVEVVERHVVLLQPLKETLRREPLAKSRPVVGVVDAVGLHGFSFGGCVHRVPDRVKPLGVPQVDGTVVGVVPLGPPKPRGPRRGLGTPDGPAVVGPPVLGVGVPMPAGERGRRIGALQGHDAAQVRHLFPKFVPLGGDLLGKDGP